MSKEEKKAQVSADVKEEKSLEGVQKEDSDSVDKEKYELTLENLLKAGVHFGHKKSRWNPKMDPYIFGLKNGVHIINLEKAIVLFREAMEMVREIVKNNEEILIIGTKKQIKEKVKEMAEKVEMPYVSERWIGGTFTNFDNIAKRIKYLINTQEALEQGRLSHLTKLEKNKLQKELDKIEEKMGGLKRLKRIPRAIFVLDIQKDSLAIKEAKQRGITTIGLIDTNSNPEEVDYAIPCNDDAFSSLEYVIGVLMYSILESK